MSHTLVVGSVALDTIETPFGRVEEVPGGSAVHFSAAASVFGPRRKRRLLVLPWFDSDSRR